jgi:hypothetical protein
MAIARFKRGAQTINLDAYSTSGAIYRLGDDFIPPPVNMAYNISAGTSANRTGGGTLISKRTNNRQFAFTIYVSGTGEGATRGSLSRLSGIINQDSNDPLYFEVPPIAGLPEPLWGQFGAWLRYEVVTATLSLDDQYGTMARNETLTALLSLEVKPLAIGNKQQLVNASGYIFENNYGTADGVAKSAQMFIATTNKMTNPVFGHATYDNGWTIGASLIASKNTAAQFILPGLNQSVKITSSSAANNTIYQTINAGNTNKHSISAYVMRPDGGAVTSADLDMVYNGGIATTFQNLGNGLYLSYSDNFDGIASNVAAGINVYAGRSVYLLGMQLEELAAHTPLAYGDLLGCAWSSSAHDSTSTRTASNNTITRTEDILSLGQWAISVVWKPYYSNTYAVDQYFAAVHTTGTQTILCYYESSDDKFYLTDGTNSIATAAQTFSAGDVIYLTFVAGNSGLAIYKNGASAATGATYTPPVTNNTTLSIGALASVAPPNGDIIGFDTYATELTAAQALALYNAQYSAVSNGNRVSSIPFLWTKDGDGVVDNCNDATRDNWGCVSGIIGSMEAETLLDFQTLGNLSSSAISLSCVQTNHFINPVYFYEEIGGTGSDSAGCSNEDYFETSLGGPDDASFDIPLYPISLPAFLGKEFVGFCRCYDSSSTNFMVYPEYAYLNLRRGDYKEYVQLGNAFRLIRTKPMVFPNLNVERNDFNLAYHPTATFIGMYFARTGSSGGGNMRWDYAVILPRPIMVIEGIANAQNGVTINGNKIRDYYPVDRTPGDNYLTVTGDIIEFIPGQYNTLVSVYGNTTTDATITNTLTYSIAIRPRYTLL